MHFSAVLHASVRWLLIALAATQDVFVVRPGDAGPAPLYAHFARWAKPGDEDPRDDFGHHGSTQNLLENGAESTPATHRRHGKAYPNARLSRTCLCCGGGS